MKIAAYQLLIGAEVQKNLESNGLARKRPPSKTGSSEEPPTWQSKFEASTDRTKAEMVDAYSRSDPFLPFSFAGAVN